MAWSAKCEVQVWRVEVHGRNARCMWNVKKVFAWRCIATWSHAGHVPGGQQCNTLAHSAHTWAWLAHGACKFYRCERSYRISVRQLPPCLVRVLLAVTYMTPWYICQPSKPSTADQLNQLPNCLLHLFPTSFQSLLARCWTKGRGYCSCNEY